MRMKAAGSPKRKLKSPAGTIEEFGAPADVSSRVYRHPLFSIGCGTFYSSVVASRAATFEVGRESATTAVRIVSNFRAAARSDGERRNAPPPSSRRLLRESWSSQRCLFNCQRAILPAPVKRVDSFNIIIRLTGRSGTCKRLWCGLSGGRAHAISAGRLFWRDEKSPRSQGRARTPALGLKRN